MKKKFLLSIVLPLMGLTAWAQNGTTWGPFENTSIWANWYLGADAGAQTIWGNSELSPLRHNVDLQLGKWCSPFFGIRLKAEMGRFKTSITASEYRNQQFSDFIWHADAQLNFTNVLLGYKPDRFYNLIGSLGAGLEHTWGSASANVKGKNRRATQPALFAGIKNTFRLSPSFDINFEVQGALMPKEIEGDTYKGWRSHGQLSAMIGISYKFKPRGFQCIRNTDCSQYSRRITQLERELNICNQENLKNRQELQNANTNVSAQNDMGPQCPPNATGQTAQCNAAGMQPGVSGGNMPCNQCNKDGSCAPMKRPNQGINPIYMPEMAVFFDINSSVLTEREMLQLQLYADAIKAACCSYVIVGYADLQTGSKVYNEKLALKRAQAVMNLLVQKYGVNAQLLNAEVGNLANPPFTDHIYNRTSIIRVPQQ